MTPLRVCHVSLTLKTGGLERLLAGMAKHHDPKRTALTFVVLRETGRFADEIRSMGFDVVQIPSTSRFRMLNELRRFFRGKFDVIHTHNTYPHIYATLAARWARIPIVVQTRHGQRMGYSRKDHLLYRLVAIWVDRIVAVSNDAAKLCIQEDKIPESKVVTIWNGIDPDAFSFAGPKLEPTAIAVGRLAKEKGFDTLLRATAIVGKQIPEFRLRFVGDGDQRPELERLSQELNLKSHVEFLGERSDVSSLMSQSGFYVSSSLSEGISLTILEAMAVGLPVIATAVGGNPEIVIENETGYLVPVSNPEAMARKMIELCNSRSQWPNLGAIGRDRLIEHFSIHKMTEAYESLYEELFVKK